MARTLVTGRLATGTPTTSYVVSNESQAPSLMNIFYRLTPQTVSRIIKNAELHGKLSDLYWLYDQMETSDTRIAGLTGQLLAALAGLPVEIVPNYSRVKGENELADKYVEYAEYLMAFNDTHALTKAMARAHTRGVQPFQIAWDLETVERNKRVWVPYPKPLSGIALEMDRDGESATYGELMVKINRMDEPVPFSRLPDTSFLVLDSGNAENNYDRMGVFRTLLSWWLGIQFAHTWWLQYVETYGSPLRIGRYQRGKNSDRAMMEKYLQMLGRNGYGLFPNDMQLQLIDANRSGQVTTFEDFIRKGHDEYSIALLGQADTVGDRKQGSFARNVVSNDIRQEILQNVADLVAHGYRMLLAKMIRANFGTVNVRLLPNIVPILVDPTDADKKARTAVEAQNNGIPIRRKYWYNNIVPGAQPIEGEEAILHGKLFVFGVDDEPEPQAPPSNNGGERPSREVDESGDSSVANTGRETTD